MIFELVILAVFGWLLHVHLSQKRKSVNLPGPKHVPFLGQFLSLEQNFHKFFYKMSEKYGKAVYFAVMKERMVVIGDAKLAKELYSLDQTTGRPFFDFFLMYEGEPLGVVNASGNLWETHRRFTLRQLRDFGFGKNTMEAMIMDEVREFVDNLKKKKGAPVGGIKELFSLAVVNSLWTVVSGKRYGHDDPKLRSLTKNLNRILTAPAENGGILFFTPWLRHIMPKFTGFEEIQKGFAQLKEFVSDAVQEHKNTIQPDYNRDFIDVFLKEVQAEKDPSSPFYGEAAEKQLSAIVADLFFAGNDTTSTTLSWAMLYLAMFPETQYKLHKEIVGVTGGSRNVEIADRSGLSYFQAFIDETLRLSSIAPNGVSHNVTSDFTHNGIHYPKGTRVEINIFYIHRNPETWGDPDNFRPERFLIGEGNTYKKDENMVSFSIGKRQYLGEIMARTTLFLFIGRIVQNFEIMLENDKPKPSLEPAAGFLLAPQEYKVIFKARN